MTVHPVEPFLSGYRHFKSAGYENQRALYTHLEQGQSPTAAIIACADSRVDPATIFAAAPGELFVIRNVGNMVPPFDSEGGVHGVSAAVEFAVQMLGVSEVLIMGHGQCGGIAACLEAVDTAPVGTFIAPGSKSSRQPGRACWLTRRWLIAGPSARQLWSGPRSGCRWKT